MRLFRWHPIPQKLLGGKNTKPFINLSLGKADPFTLESHIHVKALKMHGS